MPGIVCQRIRVSGVVQGVGFRPFVWRLAKELELVGWVRNSAAGVEIEACGRPPQVNALIERLRHEAPPRARVDDVRATPIERPPESVLDFRILESSVGQAKTMIGHDTATCPECISELFDPKSRRWRYALTSCTQCGPRYSISRGIPYDRTRTSLADFAMCDDCRDEYARPTDRRFHAEANACPHCGPRPHLLDPSGKVISGDPVEKALQIVRKGGIIAMKGLGGFHLVCDARNADAVAELRLRKGREEKPFAVMAANSASAASMVQIRFGEPGLLESPERPILLMKKRPASDELLVGVAPGVACLGVMLPCTPLQYLIFHEAAGRPAGTSWLSRPQELCLVMTSANPGGEPLVISNEEALSRLAGIADAFLIHDRDILIRCEVTFFRISPAGVHFVIRARGQTPRAIKLPYAGPSTLAIGGRLKNTVCVTRGNEAFVSQHIGDLHNEATCAFMEQTVEHLLDILQVWPERVAHDLSLETYSTRFALDFANRHELPAIAVQHHHAHLAALLAEHGIRESILGLALDGVGHGSDGRIWGGELMRVSRREYSRLGSLLPLPLMGEKFSRKKPSTGAGQPWQMAAGALHRLGYGPREISRRFSGFPVAELLEKQAESSGRVHSSTSLGHWLDTVAGVLGISRTTTFEGQSALLLEGAAERYGEMLPFDQGWRIDGQHLDLTPLLKFLAEESNPGRGAAIFHATLAAALVDWVRMHAGPGSKVLGAGEGFLNQVLVRSLRSRLSTHDMHLVEAQKLPPSDGGLSLGQAWVAMNTQLPENEEEDA